MKSFSIFFSLLFLIPVFSEGQSFITNRIIQSGLIIDAEYHPGDFLHDDDLNFLRSRIGISVPVKSKFTIKPDFKKFALEDLEVITDWKKKALPLLNKYFQPKMHQIIWNFNVNYAHYQIPTHLQHMAGFNTGITGFHYLKKAKFVFYSGNIGINENPGNFNRLDVQGSALGGMAILSGIRSVFYFGGFVGYANNNVYPAPFVGFDTRVAKKVRLNVTLPVQIKLTFKQKKSKLSVFLGLSGFASGYELSPAVSLPGDYGNGNRLSASYLKSGIDFSVKVAKRTRFNLFVGYLPWRRFWIGNAIFFEPNLNGSPYAGFSIHQKLGKSLFDASIGNMLN